MNDPIYVPLHEADLPEFDTPSGPASYFDLPGNRRVMLGKFDSPEPGFALRFESPTNDGKVALTQFGLRPDAAEALRKLLNQHLV
jgi:hypothetical protein